MEYSYLLDMADKTEDPYMRLVYACRDYFHSVSVISLYIAWNITYK